MCVCVQAKNLETEEVHTHAWTDVDRPDHNRVGNDRHPLFCVHKSRGIMGNAECNVLNIDVYNKS